MTKELHPAIRIFGAEPETANDTFLSMQAGERIGITHPDTIADGLRSPKPGELTFPILKKLVERIILVTDDEMREKQGQTQEKWGEAKDKAEDVKDKVS